jgi:hypothetical protein
MRSLLSYGPLCARTAAPGSFAFANDWQWLIGASALWLIFEKTGDINFTSNAWANTVLTAALSALVVRFVVRFACAQAQLHDAAHAEIRKLRAHLSPKLGLLFDPKLPGCVEINGAEGERVITVRVLPSPKLRG